MQDKDFDFDDYSQDVQDAVSMALVATDVSMTAMTDSLNYFIKMLAHSITLLSDSLGLTMSEVRTRLETDLGLSGSLDIYISQISASREVINDLSNELSDEQED